MDTLTLVLIIIAIIAVCAIAFVALMYMRRERSKRLRSKYGPEYDRIVEERGDRRKAEQELATREKRVEKFHVHALSPQDQAYFADAWRREQARFVDDPYGAVDAADELVMRLMKARGYPMAEFEQRAADISVDHPRVVEYYRAAHAVALRAREKKATTEDLRQAMMHYRALFEDLLESRVVERPKEEVRK